jgi:hypothetical protein
MTVGVRLRDKNHTPFKLNGQSRTAFGLLKAPELQRLSVTVEVLRVGVMIVGVISVGVMTVGVLSVGEMSSYQREVFSLPISGVIGFKPIIISQMSYLVEVGKFCSCFTMKLN